MDLENKTKHPFEFTLIQLLWICFDMYISLEPDEGVFFLIVRSVTVGVEI